MVARLPAGEHSRVRMTDSSPVGLQLGGAASRRCEMRGAPLVEVDHLEHPLSRWSHRVLGQAGQVRQRARRCVVRDRKGRDARLVGESGSGKTTVGRAVLRRITPSEGTIRFAATTSPRLTGEPLRKLRRHMQLVFQDPYASLNPRKTILQLVGEPLIVHGVGEEQRRSPPDRSRPPRSLRAAGRHHRPLRPRVQRRAAPACRHRPRPCAAPRLHRRR